MLRADALALRDRRKRARSVSAIARNIKSRQHAEMFRVPDHPVRSIKGGFATSFLMSRPPLLYEEGSRSSLRSLLQIIAKCQQHSRRFTKGCDRASRFFRHVMRNGAGLLQSINTWICCLAFIPIAA